MGKRFLEGRKVVTVFKVPDWSTDCPANTLGYDAATGYLKYKAADGTVKTVSDTTYAAAQAAAVQATCLAADPVRANGASDDLTNETKFITMKALAEAITRVTSYIFFEDAEKTTSREENIDAYTSAWALTQEVRTDMETHFNHYSTSAYDSCKLLAEACKTAMDTHYASGDATLLAECIAAANILKDDYNQHVISSGAGQAHILGDDLIVADDASSYATLVTLLTELLGDYDAHDADAELGAAWVWHQAQEAVDHSLVSAVAPTGLHECAERIVDLHACLHAHIDDGVPHGAVDTGETAVITDPATTEEHTQVYTALTVVPISDITTLLAYVKVLQDSYVAHNTDAAHAAGWIYHVAQADNALASAVNPTDIHTAITVLNDLKAKLNLHFASAVCHTTGGIPGAIATADANYGVAFTDNHIAHHDYTFTALTGTGVVGDFDAAHVTNLQTVIGELLTAYAAHNTDSALGSAWVYHKGTSNNALASAVAPTTLQECLTRVNDLKTKYELHRQDLTSHVLADASEQVTTADSAYGASIKVAVTNIRTAPLSDVVSSWSILNSGTGTVTGVSAVVSTGYITFTFSADPQNDCIISYIVRRPAST